MTERQRIPRIAEFILLFLCAPGILWWLGSRGTEIPVIPILVLAGGVVTSYLARAAPAQLRAAVLRPWQPWELQRIGFQLLLGSLALTACVLWFHPERFFDLPRRQPRAWILLLGLYPLLSVLPQELFFRVFFFQRYAPLWNSTAPRVLASAAAFGLAHLFYGDWLSVGLATAGGLCFSWTFARTGSLILVVLEHSLYGALLFTIGMGRFFHLAH